MVFRSQASRGTPSTAVSSGTPRNSRSHGLGSWCFGQFRLSYLRRRTRPPPLPDDRRIRPRHSSRPKSYSKANQTADRGKSVVRLREGDRGKIFCCAEAVTHARATTHTEPEVGRSQCAEHKSPFQEAPAHCQPCPLHPALSYTCAGVDRSSKHADPIGECRRKGS